MGSKSFPTWVYGPDKASKLVYSQEELDALGGDWKDSPTEFAGHEESAPGAASDDGAAVNEGARPTMDLLPPNHTERDRLEAEAKMLGVTFTKKTSDEMLRRAILEKGSQ